MYCPECESEFKEGESKDIQGYVGGGDISATLVCPECKREYYIGSISQAEME